MTMKVAKKENIFGQNVLDVANKAFAMVNLRMQFNMGILPPPMKFIRWIDKYSTIIVILPIEVFPS